ncbi:MAG: Ig-like domain-containing protein [Bacteroides thetaiotaomicron]
MATLKVAYHATNKEAHVLAQAASLPGGTVNVGTFSHPDAVYPDSVTIFHGVRDLLYKRSAANPANTAMFPENITDMHNVTIHVTRVEGLSVAPATASIAVAGTQQLTPTLDPVDATIVEVMYSSSDEAIATVDATGLVTGVSAGVATITAVTADGGFVDTSVITVTA